MTEPDFPLTTREKKTISAIQDLHDYLSEIAQNCRRDEQISFADGRNSMSEWYQGQAIAYEDARRRLVEADYGTEVF